MELIAKRGKLVRGAPTSYADTTAAGVVLPDAARCRTAAGRAAAVVVPSAAMVTYSSLVAGSMVMVVATAMVVVPFPHDFLDGPLQ